MSLVLHPFVWGSVALLVVMLTILSRSINANKKRSLERLVAYPGQGHDHVDNHASLWAWILVWSIFAAAWYFFLGSQCIAFYHLLSAMH